MQRKMTNGVANEMFREKGKDSFPFSLNISLATLMGTSGN